LVVDAGRRRVKKKERPVKKKGNRGEADERPARKKPQPSPGHQCVIAVREREIDNCSGREGVSAERSSEKTDGCPRYHRGEKGTLFAGKNPSTSMRSSLS